jgi:hypothetical protein
MTCVVPPSCTIATVVLPNDLQVAGSAAGVTSALSKFALRVRMEILGPTALSFSD